MNRRPRRVARHLRHQRGLTLIELLMTLALTTLIVGFVAAGLSMSRRASAWDGTAQRAARAGTALQSMRALIEAAVPAGSVGAQGQTRIAFDGRTESLNFITAGDGLVLRGGLWSVTLHLEDGDVIAAFTPARDGQEIGDKANDHKRTVVLCSGIDRLTFDYFGAEDQTARQDWRGDWEITSSLPSLVEVSLALHGRETPLSLVSRTRPN